MIKGRIEIFRPKNTIFLAIGDENFTGSNSNIRWDLFLRDYLPDPGMFCTVYLEGKEPTEWRSVLGGLGEFTIEPVTTVDDPPGSYVGG